MTPKEEDIKIIQFKPERSFTRKRPDDVKQRLCTHKNILVDEENRMINCQECNIVLDPFDYLLKVCYQDESAFNNHTQLLIEVEKLKKKYNNLTKEIQRLNTIKKQLK